MNHEPMFQFSISSLSSAYLRFHISLETTWHSFTEIFNDSFIDYLIP